MQFQDIPSDLLREATEQMARLPGIGAKTALRLALHLLHRSDEEVHQFSDAFVKLKRDIQYCSCCNNLSDTPICSICASSQRDRGIICVVESIKDVMSFEATLQYKGLYHVLGGIISPMQGIGPGDLAIELLLKRVQDSQVKEVIIALNTNMEGETTAFYLYKKLRSYPIQITSIARGIGFGDEIEYADEITLGRSIRNRVNIEESFGK
jgi:recombination protein RecR